MKNKISRISPERKMEIKELIEQIRQESYDQGYEDGKAFVSVETVEDNTITHEGKLLRKVNREALTGDYVRFASSPNKDTKANKFYEVHENGRYRDDDNRVLLVYGWSLSHRSPEVFKVIDTVEPKTANQQRGELIEKAKKFVEKYQAVRLNEKSPKTGNETAREHYYEAEFFTKGRKVTAVIYHLIFGSKRAGHSSHEGRANCAPLDVFNEWIGKAIALARALQIDIPLEFLEAVQPNEVVVGHKVRGNYAEENYEVPAFHSHEHLDGMYGRAIAIHGINKAAWVGTEQVTIIDDTNAQYEIPS